MNTEKGKAVYRLSFDEKFEWLDDGALTSYPLGTLVLAALNTDFERVCPYEAEKAPSLWQEADYARYFERCRDDLAGIHPFFGLAMKKLRAELGYTFDLAEWKRRMVRLRERLKTAADAVLLYAPQQETQSAVQRYYRYCRQSADGARFSVGADERVYAKRIFYADGQVMTAPITGHGPDTIPEQMEHPLFFCADTLSDIIMVDFEQMVYQNLTLKKCDYCGSYFQPFSVRAIYCDRLVGESGKTCKELAAREKYEKKIADDEGLSLYQRRNKAYAMRVSRSPEVYTEADYQMWKANAEVAVRKYINGELSFAVLKFVLQLPKRK